MPTEINKFSDVLGHDYLKTVPLLTGTALFPRSRVQLDISRLATASFFALMMGHTALGDDGDNDTDNSLNRIIVTATRTPLDESQIGSAFSQLTQEELETLFRIFSLSMPLRFWGFWFFIR